MKKLYHYTRAGNIQAILEAGQIVPATAYIDPGEKPVVWLSSAPHWEPTATPGRAGSPPLSFEEFAEIETPIRIEVDASKYRLGWLAFVKLSGVKKSTAKGLKQSAKEVGSRVEGWRISFDPIPDRDWLKVEGYFDGKWKEAFHRAGGDEA